MKPRLPRFQKHGLPVRKSPEAQRAKGPSTPSSMRGDPPAQKAGGEARTKACRRGVQRGALSPLPTTRTFTEAPHDHQVDDWACGEVKGLQRRAVPLRTSKGSTSSRRTRGSCLGIKQEGAGGSSSLRCDFVKLLGRLLLPPRGKACGKAFRRKRRHNRPVRSTLIPKQLPLAVRLGARQGSRGKESHRGARIARR